MSGIRLLVYGSLFNRDSASAGIGRPLTTEEYDDCVVRGYRLSFDLLEEVEVNNKPMQACFLNIVPDADGFFPAKIISIDSKELFRLHAREKNYDLMDITHHVYPAPVEPVITFVGNAHYCIDPDTPPLVLERYIAKVTHGLQGFSHTFTESYLACLSQAAKNTHLVSGTYRFTSTLQNAMTNC